MAKRTPSVPVKSIKSLIDLLPGNTHRQIIGPERRISRFYLGIQSSLSQCYSSHWKIANKLCHKTTSAACGINRCFYKQYRKMRRIYLVFECGKAKTDWLIGKEHKLSVWSAIDEFICTLVIISVPGHCATFLCFSKGFIILMARVRKIFFGSDSKLQS